MAELWWYFLKGMQGNRFCEAGVPCYTEKCLPPLRQSLTCGCVQSNQAPHVEGSLYRKSPQRPPLMSRFWTVVLLSGFNQFNCYTNMVYIFRPELRLSTYSLRVTYVYILIWDGDPGQSYFLQILPTWRTPLQTPLTTEKLSIQCFYTEEQV